MECQVAGTTPQRHVCDGGVRPRPWNAAPARVRQTGLLHYISPTHRFPQKDGLKRFIRELGSGEWFAAGAIACRKGPSQSGASRNAVVGGARAASLEAKPLWVGLSDRSRPQNILRQSPRLLPPARYLPIPNARHGTVSQVPTSRMNRIFFGNNSACSVSPIRSNASTSTVTGSFLTTNLPS